MSDFKQLAEAVFRGDFGAVRELTRQMIDSGVAPLEIVNNGLIEGMNIVAPKFKAGEMFVPEVMMAAKAMQEGLDLVKPLLVDTEMPSKGTVVIGTVAGDLHDIGKNLVVMILESGGFKVVDLGVDVSPEKFVEAVKEHKPQIVGMSALLTTTMPWMKSTIETLEEAGLRRQVKVIIGGAPVTEKFAEEIGADGYAPDAMSAKELCENLIS